jgi:hypothetical protein
MSFLLSKIVSCKHCRVTIVKLGLSEPTLWSVLFEVSVIHKCAPISQSLTIVPSLEWWNSIEIQCHCLIRSWIEICIKSISISTVRKVQILFEIFCVDIYYIALNIAWQNWYFHHSPMVYSMTFNKHYEFRLLVTRSWGCMVLPLSWSCWIDVKVTTFIYHPILVRGVTSS